MCFITEDGDNEAYDINANPTRVQVKLLCGADLLESFAVPDLWSKDDVSYKSTEVYSSSYVKAFFLHLFLQVCPIGHV